MSGLLPASCAAASILTSLSTGTIERYELARYLYVSGNASTPVASLTSLAASFQKSSVVALPCSLAYCSLPVKSRWIPCPNILVLSDTCRIGWTAVGVMVEYQLLPKSAIVQSSFKPPGRSGALRANNSYSARPPSEAVNSPFATDSAIIPGPSNSCGKPKPIGSLYGLPSIYTTKFCVNVLMLILSNLSL